eukprot:jgi/Psemu1/263891/estExt_Genewise1Plus.C_12390007
MYQLGYRKVVVPAAEIANLQPPQQQQQQQQQQATPQQLLQQQQQQQQQPPIQPPVPFGAPQQGQQAQGQPTANNNNNNKPVVLHPSNLQYPNLEYPLTGQSISNGRGTKYLLAGTPKRKPSGRSEIVMAYQCNEQFQLIDGDNTTPVVVKLSTYKEKLRREYTNFQRIQEATGGGGGGDDSAVTNNNRINHNHNDDHPFVRCYDFFPVCEGSIKYAQHSAIVLEKGYEDLREYEYRLQVRDDPEYPIPTTIDPCVVQEALRVAAKGLHTLHTKARLVYTDLKAENLILMRDQEPISIPMMDDDDQQQQQPVVVVDLAPIKGIDLESCIPIRGNPLDYTPEASPPEFARYHLNGNPYDFVLDYSYDVWSFGMLAFELATGRPYFRGKTPEEIMRILGDANFVPPRLEDACGDANANSNANSNACHDELLADLMASCLRIDPRRRLSSSKLLQHRYFKQSPVRRGGNGNADNNDNSVVSTFMGGTFW